MVCCNTVSTHTSLCLMAYDMKKENIEIMNVVLLTLNWYIGGYIFGYLLIRILHYLGVIN